MNGAKESTTNGHGSLNRDHEIRKYKNEIRDLKSKLDLMSIEVIHSKTNQFFEIIKSSFSRIHFFFTDECQIERASRL